MSIFAQHGYGKGNKLDAAFAAKVVDGVILSPRDETRENMTTVAAGIRRNFPQAAVMFDPQLYAAAVPGARDGHLSEYPYYRPGLTRRDLSRPGDLRRLAEATLAYQRTLDVTRLLAPTICFDDFRDPWSQIAVSFASEALELVQQGREGPRMLISLVIAESAFASRDGMEEFLDLITGLDAVGFYLVVKRESTSYQATFAAERLKHLLYFVYSLSAINGFEVICGFSDLVGVLLHAVGASHTATGWSTGLRQFTLARFQPASGGRHPRPRYTSAPLLNSILVSELDALAALGVHTAVLSGTPEDRGFSTTPRPSSIPWPPETTMLHHWRVLSGLVGRIGGGDVADRLGTCSSLITNAAGAYAALQRRGASFDWSSNSSHLTDWEDALAGFRLLVGI